SIGPEQTVQRIRHLNAKPCWIRPVSILFNIIRNQQTRQIASGVVEQLSIQVATHRCECRGDESHCSIWTTKCCGPRTEVVTTTGSISWHVCTAYAGSLIAGRWIRSKCSHCRDSVLTEISRKA